MNYKTISLEYVNRDEINIALQYIKSKNLKRRNFNLTKSSFFFMNSYQVKKSEGSIEIIYWNEKCYKRIKWSKDKAYPENVENCGMTGQTSYEYINNEYIKTKKNKKSLFSDISGRKYKTEYNAIKKCVPAAINYASWMRRNKITEHVYKADVSSAYPTAACGSIPTLHGFKKVKGRVEPNDEYPFAFYIHSHHLSIFEELDTREFKDSNYYPQYKHPAEELSWHPIDNIKDEDEETILCKDSGISLKPIFEELYSNRKEHAEFKFIMNAFIGRCQLNSDPFMSHLSAVVLARCVNNMIRRCRRLEAEGSYPIFISTDSIAWKGKPSSCAVFDKYLGSFTYEAYDTKFFLRGLKAYQYYDLNGNVAGVCGHIPKNDIRRKTFGMIPEVSAPEYYVVNDDGSITEIM